MEFISHRGESADAPENTLAAFRLSWERRVGAIELDVHLTKDRKLICAHDPDTLRTSGHRIEIRSATYDQLREIDVGTWKGEKWIGETMPLLESVLREMPISCRCFVEVKEGPEAIIELERLIRIVDSPTTQITLISFNGDTVLESKRRLPDVEACLLAEFHPAQFGLSPNELSPNDTGWTSDNCDITKLIAKARNIGANGLDLDANGVNARSAIQSIRDAGLMIYVWTVDDTEVARQLVDWGVDGITSNRAAWLREQLRQC